MDEIKNEHSLITQMSGNVHKYNAINDKEINIRFECFVFED